MSWSCDQMEARLSDYLESSLTAEERSGFEAHLQMCVRCARLLPEISDLIQQLHSMEQLPAPPRLFYSILDKTIGPRPSRTGWRALFGWSRAIPNAQLAYGALSVIATFSIFFTASGANWRHPNLADLRPINFYRQVDRHAHMLYARGTKFVNNMKLVREIESSLRQEEAPTTPENNSPETAPQNPSSPHSDGSGPASPRQQNHANDLLKPLVFAEILPFLNGSPASSLIRRRLP